MDAGERRCVRELHLSGIQRLDMMMEVTADRGRPNSRTSLYWPTLLRELCSKMQNVRGMPFLICPR